MARDFERDGPQYEMGFGGSGRDWIENLLDQMSNQGGVASGKETPGRGNPYETPMSPGGGGASGPTPAGGGGDKFSRGMDWLSTDLGNWDRFDTPGGGSRPGGVPLDNAFAPGNQMGMPSGKETPGGGNPYANPMEMTPNSYGNRDQWYQDFNPQVSQPSAPATPFASGPHGVPAGPSIPLQGMGAPVSPFMSENIAFQQLQQQQQAALDAYNKNGGDAGYGMPTPNLPTDPDALRSFYGDVRGSVMPPQMPSLSGLLGSPLSAWLGGGTTPIPPNQPIAPGPRSADEAIGAYERAPRSLPGFNPASSLNRQLGGNMGGPLGAWLAAEEPFGLLDFGLNPSTVTPFSGAAGAQRVDARPKPKLRRR